MGTNEERIPYHEWKDLRTLEEINAFEVEYIAERNARIKRHFAKYGESADSMAMFQTAERRRLDASVNKLNKVDSLRGMVGPATMDVSKILCVIHDDQASSSLPAIDDVDDGKLIFYFQLPTTHRFLDGLPSNWRPTKEVLKKRCSYEEAFDPTGAPTMSSKSFKNLLNKQLKQAKKTNSSGVDNEDDQGVPLNQMLPTSPISQSSFRSKRGKKHFVVVSSDKSTAEKDAAVANDASALSEFLVKLADVPEEEVLPKSSQSIQQELSQHAPNQLKKRPRSKQTKIKQSPLSPQKEEEKQEEDVAAASMQLPSVVDLQLAQQLSAEEARKRDDDM